MGQAGAMLAKASDYSAADRPDAALRCLSDVMRSRDCLLRSPAGTEWRRSSSAPRSVSFWSLSTGGR